MAAAAAISGHTDRVRRSHHEAAHALVGKLCGFQPLDATVDADFGGPGGYVCFSPRDVNAHNLRDHLAMTIAGYVGDELLGRAEWWRVDLLNVLDREKGRAEDRGTRMDWRDWIRLVARLHRIDDWFEAEGTLHAELEAARRDVVGILQHYERSWHTLAERLCTEGTVSLSGWKPSL